MDVIWRCYSGYPGPALHVIFVQRGKKATSDVEESLESDSLVVDRSEEHDFDESSEVEDELEE